MNIKQIAKTAGVSVATVSRVMNHPETVAPATKAKIEKVMKEAGYKPNWFAQGLNFNTTKTIGIVIPHMLTQSYMEIANGIEEVARMRGYITFMCNVQKDIQTETPQKLYVIAVPAGTDGASVTSNRVSAPKGGTSAPKEILLPGVPEFILDKDPAKGRILVRLPEGLLEL